MIYHKPTDKSSANCIFFGHLSIVAAVSSSLCADAIVICRAILRGRRMNLVKTSVLDIHNLYLAELTRPTAEDESRAKIYKQRVNSKGGIGE